MPFLTGPALVVRGTDWSETSRIVTLFTPAHGRLRALAKGGRRLRGAFEGALDLLTVLDVVVIAKGNGGLDLLTEARVAEAFPGLRRHLPSLYAGYYVAELVADGTQDYDPHPALYAAAVGTLRALSAGGDAGASPLPAVAAFEVAWLRELGYAPRLDRCAGCDRPRRNPAAGAPFSPSLGGVVCPGCRAAAPDRRALSAGGLAALGRLASGEVTDGGREVRLALGQAVSYVLGRRPRLLAELERL